MLSVVFEFWQTSSLLYPTVSSLYPTEFPKSREIPAFILFLNQAFPYCLCCPWAPQCCVKDCSLRLTRPCLSEECWPF